MKVSAIIPIKAYSERLKNKNFLEFCGQPLYRVILDKLQDIDLIQEIVINTDSEIIANDCSERYSKSVIIERPDNIRGNSVTANTLIEYTLTKIQGEHFLQTHCTNPLLTKKTIIKAIQTYFGNSKEFDSLFSVQTIHKRAYHKDGSPINHCNTRLEQTQDLSEILIENSNLFLFSRTSFANCNNSRIGKRPQILPMNSMEGIDIDYPEDFILAELIHKNKLHFTDLE